MRRREPRLLVVTYECWECGKLLTFRELMSFPTLRCSACGCRIFKKIRPPIVKRVKAL